MSESQPRKAVRTVLIGASGRMGRAILAAAPGFGSLTLVAAIASRASAALGQDSGRAAGAAANGVPLTSDLGASLARADVVIDFSQPQATGENLAACRAAGRPLLIGTTGYGTGLEVEFSAAAREIPLLIAPNTSLGVTLLIEFARAAAAALPGAAVRIEERHHAGKKDAPSGTALALQAALREGRGSVAQDPASLRIPIDSHREGELVGEHQVVLCGAGEELVLRHRALDRGLFARGALAAALWLASRPPGRYAMRDLLVAKTVT